MCSRSATVSSGVMPSRNCEVTVTGAITDVNPFLIKMLGFSREEFVEKKLWEVGAFKDVEASQEAGFGLFSIRERLAALGGDARFKSQPGEGFEAMLCVPVSEDQQSAPADAAVGADAQPQP